MERNREIDLYRVLFAIIVVFVHSHGLRVPDPTHYPFCGGYLALYVSHWTVRAVIPVIMPGIAYEKMLIPYLLGSLIYAGGYVTAINAVRRLSLPEKLKRCFLLQKYQ